jgi:hypothetical protein
MGLSGTADPYEVSLILRTRPPWTSEPQFEKTCLIQALTYSATGRGFLAFAIGSATKNDVLEKDYTPQTQLKNYV